MRRSTALLTVLALLAGALAMLAASPTAAAAPAGRWVDGTYTSWFGYQPVTPARVFDSRPGQATVDGQYSGGGAFGATGTQIQMLGRGGVPKVGVGAVVVTLTAISQKDTFLSVSGNEYPTSLTTTSMLNVAAGQTAANTVVSKLYPDGNLLVRNDRGPTHVIIDVVGYFRDTMAEFVPLTPKRLLDTRAGQATGDGQQAGVGAIGPGGTLDLQVGGRFGVPSWPSGLAAVVNVTAVTPTQNTYLSVYPGSTPRPLASTVNAAAGAVVPNLAVVGLDTSGRAQIFNASGSSDVVVDVVGYVHGAFTTTAPQRLADTRPGQATVDGIGAGSGAVAPDGSLTVKVAGRAGVPADALAVLINVTAIEPTADTYLTVHPGSETRPLASSLNLPRGGIRAASVLAKVGSDGTVTIYNSSGWTHVAVDISGWAPRPSSAFTGRVVDPTTSAPLAGLDVYATNDDVNLQYRTTTDAQGRYLLGGLPEQRFLVCFGGSQPGVPGSHGCFDPWGDQRGIDPQGTQTLNWADRAGQFTRIDVTDPQGHDLSYGSVITYQPVESGRASISRDSIPGVNNGWTYVLMDVRVCASKAGYLDGCYVAPGAPAGTTGSVVDPLRTPSITIVLTKA